MFTLASQDFACTFTAMALDHALKTEPGILARAASLSGTRAMIANEQFAALALLIVETGMCSGERVRQMIDQVSARIAAPNCEWMTNASEIRAHQQWLRGLKEKF